MRIELKNGKTVKILVTKQNETYEYFIDGIRIGAYTPKVMEDHILIRENTLENELSSEIKDKINALSKEEIENEAVSKENILESGNELGIERIKKVYTIDLEDKEEDKEDTEIKKEKIYSQTENHKEQVQSKNFTIHNTNIKQETELDERATDVQDFRRWLESNGAKIPKDFVKIGVIESDTLRDMKDENGKTIDNSSTRFGLVLIGKNGKVEPLKKYVPQLEQNHSSGNDPIESQYQIHTDGSVEKDPVLSEYRIGRAIIQLDKDHGDDLEVNIGKYSPFGNELVTTKMRDKNTQFATDTQTRKTAMGHYEGVYKSRNSYQEAQKHEKVGCEPENLTEKEIDGDPNTGHQHLTEEEMQKAIEQIMKNDEIQEVFTENEVREKLEKMLEERRDISTLLEEAEKELEEDALHFRTR